MPQLTGKVLNYASIIDHGTLNQAHEAAKLDIIAPYIALMPDAHLGKGATVGSVIPTVGAVIPSAVGVDLGCGVICHKTDLNVEELMSVGKPLSQLREDIERRIPLSAGKVNTKKTRTAEESWWHLEQFDCLENIEKSYPQVDWRMQLGTLGGGNHFIEVCKDEDNNVWLFLHSGSRGIGNKIGSYWIKRAEELSQGRWTPSRDLGYILESEEDEFNEYMLQTHWAQEWAMHNRLEMMYRVEEAVQDFVNRQVHIVDRANVHHNYIATERHFDEWIYVTRKGAINAEKGNMLAIPGSMGTASYVCEGKGNPESFNSAPHGAGREYSRSKAKATFTLEDLKARMEGIEYRVSESFVDEIPDAYKPIDQVMEDSSELVTIKHKLNQLINVKGD